MGFCFTPGQHSQLSNANRESKIEEWLLGERLCQKVGLAAFHAAALKIGSREEPISRTRFSERQHYSRHKSKRILRRRWF